MSVSVNDPSGVDKLSIYFNGRLITTIRRFPMSPRSFYIKGSKGKMRALQLYATDRFGNVTKVTVLVDVM